MFSNAKGACMKLQRAEQLTEACTAVFRAGTHLGSEYVGPEHSSKVVGSHLVVFTVQLNLM